MRRFAILSILLFLMPGVVWAQEEKKDETEERLRALEERIIALEAEIRVLKSDQAKPVAAEVPVAPAPAPAAVAAPPATVPSRVGTASVTPSRAPETMPTVTPPTVVQAPTGAPGGPSGALPVYGGAAALAKILNPDISVVGNFLGAAGRNSSHPVPALEMHETEIALQAIVDPYARADFFVSLTPEGVELEEGYLTFTALPGGFVAKAGKMRAAFGRVNALHNDGLPWTDRPLVTENLVAGEEGINDAGFSVSRILPAPKNVFLEATAQVFRGDSEGLFSATNRSDLALVGHLRGYHDLTEASNLDLGFSYARGHNDLGSAFRTQLYGLDATFRWRPLRRAIYHNFLARTELVWSRRQQQDSIQRAFGFYTAADYRLSRRWTLGGRYDRSEQADNTLLTDSGFSPVVTYWPSEFSQIRAQYRFADYAEGSRGNELRFQFLFNLGTHAAHPF